MRQRGENRNQGQKQNARKSGSKRRGPEVAAALAMAVLTVGVARAATTYTWQNVGTDFNTNANWSPSSGFPGSTPTLTDIAAFTGAQATNPNLSASVNLGEVSFTTAASSGYTLSANPGVSLTIGFNAGSGTAITSLATSGTNTISAPIILGYNAGTTATISGNTNGTLVISGNISSTNAITGLQINPTNNASASFIALSGNNTYSGNTTVGFCTLDINSSTALGTGGILTTNNNAHFDNTSGNDAVSVVQGFSDIASGGMTYVGTNSLTFQGTVNLGLGLSVNTGSNSKTLTYSGSTSFAAAQTFTVNNSGSLVFGGPVNFGAFLAQKSGTGSLVLNGAGAGTGISESIGSNTTYVADLRINAGSVLVGNAAAFSTGVVDIRGATLASDLSSGTLTLNNTFVNATATPTIGSSGTGTGNIILAGAIVPAATFNTSALAYVVSNGASAASSLNITNSGTTTISGAVALNDGTSTTNHTLTVNVTGGPLTISGAIINTAGSGVTNGSMVLTGGGMMIFSGANTYTGGTTVGAGTLQMSGSGTLGATSNPLVVNTGGTLDLNGTSQTVGSLTGTTGTILNNGVGTSTLTIGTGNATGGSFTGSIIDNNNSGAGKVALTKVGTGTFTFAGANTYSGATTISGGTVVLSNASLSNTAGVSIAPSTTFLVNGTANAAGVLNLNAGGTLDLRGSTTTALSTGSLTFGGGTLNLNLWTGTADGITSTGAASITGTNTINLSVPVGQSVTPGNYTLMTAASGLATGFALGTIPTGFFTFSLSSSTPTSEVLSIVGQATPPIAYWSGLASVAAGGTEATANHWGAGTIQSGKSNWSSTADGLTDTVQVPGGSTDVILTASNAVGISGALNTSLDTQYQIKGLTFDVPAPTGITSAGIATTSANTLTVGADGITLAATSNATGTISGAGAVILNGSQTWTNNGNLNMTVSSPVTALPGATTLTTTTNGTGAINLNGAIGNGAGNISLTVSNSLTGATQLGGVSTYTGATNVAAGSLVLNGTIGLAGGTAIAVNNSATFTENATGVIAGTSSLTINGSGIAMLNGTNTYTGATNIHQTGVLTVSGGITGSTGATLSVSPTFGDTATLNVSGGTVVANQLLIAGNSSAGGTTSDVTTIGTVNQTGGNVNASSNVIVGQGSTNFGTIVPVGIYNLTGGNLSLSGGSLQIASGQLANGTLNISGSGAVNLFNNVSLSMGSNTSAGNGTINQSGGRVTFYSNAGTTVGGTGVLFLGQTTNAGVGGLESANYIYNLDGGTLTVPQIQANSTNGATVSLLNLNGGTLKAAATNSNWIQNLTHVYVQSGGAIIDDGGFAVTIAPPLEQDPNSTGGGLTKQGSGVLTLSGASTYTGSTTVTGGSLVLSASGSLATSAITINGSGARFVQSSTTPLTVPVGVITGTLDGTSTVGTVTVAAGTGGIVSNGFGTSASFTVGSLTFNGSGGLSLIPAGGTANHVAPLVVGSLSTLGSAGSITVNASPVAPFVSGTTYDLVNFGGSAPSLSEFTLGSTFTPREQAATTFTLDGSNLAINYVGDSAEWVGSGTANWDTSSVSNWQLAAAKTATSYINLDRVLFDDSAAGSTAVTINSANVTPTSIVFNNNTKSYTFTSTSGFGIAGSTGVTKNGAGTTTLATNNTYTGATAINGGTLVLAGSNAGTTYAINPSGTLQLNFSAATSPATNILPSSTALSLNGGTLIVTGKASTTNSQVVGSTAVSGGSVITVTANATANPTSLNLATVTRNTGASLVFTLPTGTQSATNGILTSNGATNGIVGPWAVVSSTGTAAVNSAAGFTYATNSSSGNVVAFTGANINASGTSLNSQTYDGSPTINFDDAETGTIGNNFGPNVNTVRFVNTAAVEFDITSNGAFLANGILAAGAGGVTVGAGTNNGLQPGTTNELVLDAAAAPITVTGIIKNHSAGTTPGTLTIMGPNKTTLSGSNAYTGATYVDGGTLVVGGTGTINSTSGIFINGVGAKYVQTSSVASTVPLTLTQGTLDGTGTVGAVTVSSNTGAIVTNGNGSNSAFTIGSLTFLGAGTASVNYSGSPGIIVTGALTTNPAGGTQKVTVNATGAFGLGNNDLINFGTLAGSVADYTLGTVGGLNARATKSLVLDGNNIALNVVSDSPVWTGANGGIWTTNTANASNGTVSATPNWALLNAHTPSDFWAGDIVQFNDTVNINGTVVAPTTTTVAIQGGNVVPTSATFNNSALNYTLASSDGSEISGTASLTKNGTGTVFLNSANNYSGGTTVNAGTLNIGNGAALGTGRLTLNGGTFDNTTGATANVSNNITQTWVGSFTFAGTSSLNMGTGAVTLNGTPNLNVSNNTLNVGGVIGNGTGNSLTKSGGGTLTLTGFSTYTGGTTVNAGTLSLSSTGGGTGTIRGVLTVNTGGTVITTVGDAIGFTVGSQVSTVNLVGGTFNNPTGGNESFATNWNLTGGTMSATGNGAYNFDSANGYGITSLASSVTSLESAPISIRSGSLNFNVATGTTASGIDLNVTGAVFGGNGIVKNGTGTLQISGNDTYGTTTTVNGGTLQLASNTALPAGSALTIAGGSSVVVNRGAGALITLNLGSLSNSGLIDLQNNRMQIQGANSATLATVFTELQTGYNGGAWNGTSGIISSAAATNATHLLTLGETLVGSTLNVNYAYYGDADLSGIVDGSDYSRIDNGFLQQLTGWQNGDFNYDGVVNGSDYTLIDNTFNQQSGAPTAELATPSAELGGGSASSVPEPTSLALLGAGAMGLLGRRHRK